MISSGAGCVSAAACGVQTCVKQAAPTNNGAILIADLLYE
jgi:hypothetical protein